jgi:hypothetical protein
MAGAAADVESGGAAGVFRGGILRRLEVGVRRNKGGFDVAWEAEDGYVGGSRPQQFTIDTNFFCKEDTEEELRKLFNDELERDFQEKCHAVSEDEDAFVDWAKARQAEMED